MSSIEKLKAILDVDDSGEMLADMLNKMIIDERKKEILITKLVEMQRQFYTLGQEIKLTKSEEAVKGLVLGMNRPLTSQDVADNIGDKYKSLKYKTHASTALNSLVEKGILGRIKKGNVNYYIDTKEAIIEQLKRRGETPDNCSPGDISKQTGMPLNSVLDALEDI